MRVQIEFNCKSSSGVVVMIAEMYSKAQHTYSMMDGWDDRAAVDDCLSLHLHVFQLVYHKLSNSNHFSIFILLLFCIHFMMMRRAQFIHFDDYLIARLRHSSRLIA